MFICNYLLKLYKEYCRSDKKSRLLKSTEDMYILDYYGNIICLKKEKNQNTESHYQWTCITNHF